MRLKFTVYGRVANVPLPGFAPLPLLYPQNRQLSPRMRVFTQQLSDTFQAADVAV